MEFLDLSLFDSKLIKLNKKTDERGWFSRFYCNSELDNSNIQFRIEQINNSFSKESGTLRGIHFQQEPFQEAKIFSVIKGEIFFVLIDLRESSPTYLKWEGIVLNENSKNLIYSPKGFATGSLSLKNNSEMIYMVDQKYNPNAERGIKWNDKKFDIKWPTEISNVTVKDRNWPDYI